MKLLRSGIYMTALVVTMAMGCMEDSATEKKGENGKEAEPATSKSKESVKVEQEVGEALQAVRGKLNDESRELAESMRDRLEILETELQKMQGNIQRQTAESREQAKKLRKEIEPRLENFKQDLQNLKSRSGDAWRHLEEGFSSALADLEKAFREASSRLSREEKATEEEQKEENK